MISCSRSHHYVASWLDSSSTVIDLGANRGAFSFEIVQRFGCKCHAVEAVPDISKEIPEHPQIVRHNLAISPQDGDIQFSLSHQEESGSIGQLPQNMTSGQICVKGVTFKTFLRDNQISAIALLKVDIEGAEIDLLKSIEPETLEKVDQITVEFHDFLEYFDQSTTVKEVCQRMEALNFACIPYSLRCNADVIFLNRKSPKFSMTQYLCMKYLDRYMRAAGRAIGKLMSFMRN